MAKKTIRRKAVRVSIYMWPSVEEDACIVDLLDSLKPFRGRPQEVLRRALVRGVKSLIETGDIDRQIVKNSKLEERLGVEFGGGSDRSVVIERVREIDSSSSRDQGSKSAVDVEPVKISRSKSSDASRETTDRSVPSDQKDKNSILADMAGLMGSFD